MNTPISFEIAKLLKEKGFEQNHEVGIICRIQNTVNKNYEKTRAIKQSDLDNLWSVFNEIYPTIAEVIMWLYEKHRIWATVYTMDKWLPNGNDREQLFDYSLKQMKLGLIDIPKKPEEFNSPTEAYEAAIDYILKNLI